MKSKSSTNKSLPSWPWMSVVHNSGRLQNSASRTLHNISNKNNDSCSFFNKFGTLAMISWTWTIKQWEVATCWFPADAKTGSKAKSGGSAAFRTWAPQMGNSWKKCHFYVKSSLVNYSVKKGIAYRNSRRAIYFDTMDKGQNWRSYSIHQGWRHLRISPIIKLRSQ